jgi:ribokinase
MAGKLGEDVFGEQMLTALQKEGVCTKHILRDPETSTGIGSIVLDDQGRNRIVVVPGANLKYDLADLAALEPEIAGHDLIMLQLEMTLEVVTAAAKLGQRYGVPVVLDPAPAQALPEELLQAVACLTPNETEAQLLTGISVTDVDSARKAADLLLEKGPQAVIITMGEKGALLATGERTVHIPGFPVQTVDTVAAGDAFSGALATRIAHGVSLEEAVQYANAVGALAVTRPGAIPSLPTAEEVADFLASQKALQPVY